METAESSTAMQKRTDKYERLLNRRSKTFHGLPTNSQKHEKSKLEELSEMDKLFPGRRKVRPQSCSGILSGTRPNNRPLTASRLRLESRLENKKSVYFANGNSVSNEHHSTERLLNNDRATPSRERSRVRTNSASSSKRGSLTSPVLSETGRTVRSNSKPSLARVPGFIKLSGSYSFDGFTEVEHEGDEKERKEMLLERFRHAVRLVSIFSTFCMGIRRYAEQEKSTEYDLYYLRDMLPGNEDKPTPVQEASLYFNKHLFSRDNTLHFPFWARWTCALTPSDRSDAEISKLVALLRGMKSFNKFSREAQWHLCRTMTYARYEKRRIIVRQGHPGFCFYFIVSGTVSVTVKRCDLRTGIHVTNTVDVLEKNDSFGEIALMAQDARRTATIICRERVEVLVVNREAVMEHCPDVFQKDFDEKYNALRRQDLFKHWSDELLKELCFESHIKELAHGKLVDPDSTRSEAIYFVLKGKVDMLRKLDLGAVLASKASISLYENKPLPRPSSALPAKGKPTVEFVSVGSLYKNDSWDLRPLFTEEFNEPGNILVSAGVRLLKVPKQRVVQLSPLGTLEEFGKTFVLRHRCPNAGELYQEYMAAQSWIEYRQKVVQNVLDCKKGLHVAHTSSLAKGTSGWGAWPAKGTKNIGHDPKLPENT